MRLCGKNISDTGSEMERVLSGRDVRCVFRFSKLGVNAVCKKCEAKGARHPYKVMVPLPLFFASQIQIFSLRAHVVI